MDIADMADEVVEIMVASALAEARLAPTLVACGRCYNCNEDDEKLMAGKVFCCIECLEDYQHRQRMHKIAGK